MVWGGCGEVLGRFGGSRVVWGLGGFPFVVGGCWGFCGELGGSGVIPRGCAALGGLSLLLKPPPPNPDRDECTEGSHDCGGAQSCLNTFGGHLCVPRELCRGPYTPHPRSNGYGPPKSRGGDPAPPCAPKIPGRLLGSPLIPEGVVGAPAGFWLWGSPNAPFWAARTCVCPGGVPGCAPRPRWLLHRFLAIPQIPDLPAGIFQLQHPPGDPKRLRLRGSPPGTFRLRVTGPGGVWGGSGEFGVSGAVWRKL